MGGDSARDAGRVVSVWQANHAATSNSPPPAADSGYFIYDLICVLARYDLEGSAFLVHALCCLFVYGYAVFFGTLHWFGEPALVVAGGGGTVG